VLKDYGRVRAEARRQYRACTQACLLEEDGPILAAMAASRYAIGDARFVAQTEGRVTVRSRAWSTGCDRQKMDRGGRGGTQRKKT